MVEEAALQCGLAALYYSILLLMMRLAGKRLAGQTTTFDLIVLISLSVVVQNATLREGTLPTTVFVVTVFALHWLQAVVCARADRVRWFLRGKPTQLIANGEVLTDTLKRQDLSEDELTAGLRKLGFESPAEVREAFLEETGHITAIAREGARP